VAVCAVGEVEAEGLLAVVGHVLLATLDALSDPAPDALAAVVLVSQPPIDADSVELFSAGPLFASVAGLLASAEHPLALLVAYPCWFHRAAALPGLLCLISWHHICAA